MDCRFCRIIDHDGDQILRATSHSVVILSDPRLMPGHTLVIPKRHVERLSELGNEERMDIVDQVMDIQEKILEALAPGCDISQHFRPFIPENPLKVDHLHIHLRPRSLDDELYEKVQVREKEIFKSIDRTEIAKYKELFKN